MAGKKPPTPQPQASAKARVPRRILGASRAMQSAIAAASAIAPLDWSVLILGENGTGKELFAESIHAASSRAHGPFVAANVANLDPHVADAELFGVEDRTFTEVGARQGLFRASNGGTLFLDEIGLMPLETQAKVLRALQERTVRPLGARGEPIPVDFRLITATNTDLVEAQQAGRFREDLYHRISRYVVRIPSLRDRCDDIALLAPHILSSSRETAGKIVSPAALDVLMEYRWPGNVRELENVLLSAGLLVHLAGRESIDRDDVEQALRGRTSRPTIYEPDDEKDPAPRIAIKTAIVAYMSRSERAVTTSELATALRRAKNTVIAHLKELEEAGSVERRGEHKTTTYVLLPPMTQAEFEAGRTPRAQRRWDKIQEETRAELDRRAREARQRGEREWWDTDNKWFPTSSPSSWRSPSSSDVSIPGRDSGRPRRRR